MEIAPSLQLGVFLVDAIVVAASAWFLVCAAGHARHGALEAVVAWLLAGIAWVAGAGILLGQAGHLHAPGFLGLHLAGFALLLGARRASLAGDATQAREIGRALRRTLSDTEPERFLIIGLGGALALLCVLAAWAEPVVYDGLTYRLPRIGAWLHSGRIEMLPGADPRMNYMPVVPDVVMAWILGATPAGFHLLALVQALGGVLTVAATVGLARASGLNRRGALLAGCSLLGMASVVSQFTSTHTDLFTAGVLTAAGLLWLRALRRGEASTLGAVGAGLALGAKGTVFYFAPGLLLWVAWEAWRHPVGWRVWRSLVAAAALGIALFAGPGLVRNWVTYGGLFGPAESVRLHQRWPDSVDDLAQKLGRNLQATLAQLFEPHSQPAGFREAGRALGRNLAAGLPAADADAFEARGRRGTLDDLLARREPDADVATCGALAVLLAAAAGLTALVRIHDSNAKGVLVLLAGALGFVVFLSAIQQWHGYSFRFFVLAAPALAVTGAWGLEQLPRRVRGGVWAAVLAAGATTAWAVVTTTHQVGWRAITQPERSRGYFVYQQWRDWARTLAPESRALTVALPANLPLAAFFRQPERPAVRLAAEPAGHLPTAEQAAPPDHGWLVVPAGRFLGREGDVAVRTWLFRGEETSAFSLAAYRKLRPGETPAPVLYRQRETAGADGLRQELLVKPGRGEAVRLALGNPGRTAREFTVVTPLGRTAGRVAAGQTALVTIALPAGSVAEVNLVFSAGLGDTTDARPTVSLAASPP